MKRAIYPGSFDPVTFGHLDIIERASKIVDELVVGVLNNSLKNSLFSLEERVNMIKETTKDLPNVTVGSFDGLLVDYMNQIDAKAESGCQSDKSSYSSSLNLLTTSSTAS